MGSSSSNLRLGGLVNDIGLQCYLPFLGIDGFPRRSQVPLVPPGMTQICYPSHRKDFSKQGRFEVVAELRTILQYRNRACDACEVAGKGSTIR